MRSAVPKPSVNRASTGVSSSRAWAVRCCRCQRRATLVAARSSHDRASCRRAQSRACRKYSWAVLGSFFSRRSSPLMRSGAAATSGQGGGGGPRGRLRGSRLPPGHSDHATRRTPRRSRRTPCGRRAARSTRSARHPPSAPGCTASPPTRPTRNCGRRGASGTKCRGKTSSHHSMTSASMGRWRSTGRGG